MNEPEVRWVLDMLHMALRLLDVSNRHVETTNGWSPGYLSRIFSGTIKLRYDTILDIVRVAGLHPAEFFDLVHASRPQPPTAAATRLNYLLQRIRPDPPTTTTESTADLEHRLLELLRKLEEKIPGELN